jgi:pyruvate ferredoxin oxidoreductase gamma subunit
VAVVDDTLLHAVDVTKGLKEDGAILINTEKDKSEILPLLNGYKGKVYLINARKVCMKTLGKYFPNTPMLAGMVKISGVMEEESFLEEMKTSLQHKFARKPEVLEGNMQALKQAFSEVELCH